jgi:hypothetical protein
VKPRARGTVLAQREKHGLAIYDAFRAIVPVVLSITAEDTDGARALLASVSASSSRDALHLAVIR